MRCEELCQGTGWFPGLCSGIAVVVKVVGGCQGSSLLLEWNSPMSVEVREKVILYPSNFCRPESFRGIFCSITAAKTGPQKTRVRPSTSEWVAVFFSRTSHRSLHFLILGNPYCISGILGGSLHGRKKGRHRGIMALNAAISSLSKEPTAPVKCGISVVG